MIWNVEIVRKGMNEFKQMEMEAQVQREFETEAVQLNLTSTRLNHHRRRKFTHAVYLARIWFSAQYTLNFNTVRTC